MQRPNFVALLWRDNMAGYCCDRHCKHKFLGTGEWQKITTKNKYYCVAGNFQMWCMLWRSRTWIMRTYSKRIQQKYDRSYREWRKKNSTHPIFKHHFNSETQTDLSNYLQILCLLFTNTHCNETNIILKETLDMLCICKFDFIGKAVK